MTLIIGWVLRLLLHPPQEAEMSERLAPPGWQGNYWGPEATKGPSRGQDAADRRDGHTWPDGTAGAGKSCATAISFSGSAMRGSDAGISR